MKDYPKPIKKLIRQYAGIAHEEELRRALVPLAAKFDEWRVGSLSSGELSDAIHEFHNGPSRELFKTYNEPAPLDMAVAYAIATGVLDDKSMERPLLELLVPAIQFYRQNS
ncbi:MAG TPA: hypothetical protein VLM91_25910 [Candidatus Methylomirabilis sp.]|nr:hypothetical protein [Candidatus Methylomirabilis sp.]